MLNIAICEDSELTIEYIKELLKKILKNEFNLETYTNPHEFIKHFNNELDIVLMDIVFSDANGIEIVKQMQEKKYKAKIIYISEYIEYAENIFETNPVYFLKKPVKEENLKKALKKAMDDIGKIKSEEITIASKGKLIHLELSKVSLFESDRRVVIIHLGEERNRIYKKLSEIEEKLPYYFVRCHQSYIVNLKMVSKIENNIIVMKTGERINISKSKRAEVKEKIMKYIGEIL